MTPVNDLMERLAAADPVRDPGSLTTDEQRDADALLQRLLAAPVATPDRARTPRRWPQLAVATALVAVAAFAAVSLLGSDEGPGPNVVARAVAALTDDDVIYHAEVVATAQAADFPNADEGLYYETWHTASGRMRQRSYGPARNRTKRVYGEVAGQRRPGRLGGPSLTYDPLTNLIYETGFGRSRSGGKGAPGFDAFDPGRSIKELQAEGRLRVAGRVEVGGRPAYRLVSGDVTSSEGSVQRSVLLVDTETYLPRELRLVDRLPNGVTRRLRWRYVVYERLPLNDKTESLLHFHPPARAKCRPGTDKIDRKGSLGFPNPCAR